MPRTESPEDQAVREVGEEDERTVKEIAQSSGPPPNARQLSEADEDLAWSAEDTSVDYETLASQLMTQGLPPEIAQQLLIVKLRPDWAPLYLKPTGSAEQAHILARAAQYPFRLSLLEDLADPDEQVGKAERLNRRYQKRFQQAPLSPPTPATAALAPSGPPTGMAVPEPAPRGGLAGPLPPLPPPPERGY